jgi:hypothetical protein
VARRGRVLKSFAGLRTRWGHAAVAAPPVPGLCPLSINAAISPDRRLRSRLSDSSHATRPFQPMDHCSFAIGAVALRAVRRPLVWPGATASRRARAVTIAPVVQPGGTGACSPPVGVSASAFVTDGTAADTDSHRHHEQGSPRSAYPWYRRYPTVAGSKRPRPIRR